jgi:hypothetical protein
VGRGEADRISIRLAAHLSVRSFTFRKIYGPRGKEVTEGCRKLHNEDLYDLYSSKMTLIFMVFKLKHRKLVLRAAYFGEEKCVRSFVGRREKERDH